LELRARIGPAGQEAEVQFAGGRYVENLGQHGRRVVIAHDHEIATLRIHGHSSMPKVPVNDSGLVLLVIVDPKFHCGL
jgi:hypothetical protein